MVRTLGQEAVPIPDQVAVYTQARAVALTRDQVAVHIPGRVGVLRRRRVVGATADLVVAARINGIGRVLIASQSPSLNCKALAAARR